MQNVKKWGKRQIVALLAALMLVTSLFPTTIAFAADTATITVDTAALSAPVEGYEPGATFRVPITIQDNPGFAGALFRLHYDHDALELTDFVTTGTVFAGSMMLTPDPENDIISSANVTNKSGDGVLFYADFKVKDDATGGDYPITIAPQGAGEIDPFDMNFTRFTPSWVAEAIPTTYVFGSITIKTEEPPPPPPGPATISLGSIASTEAGNTFTVPVSIADNPGFAGAVFTLSYNSAALEVTNVSATGGLFAGSSVLWDVSAPNRVGYVGELPLANVTGDGKLFDVTFKVKDNAPLGNHTISLALKDGAALNFVDEDAQAIDVNFTSTSVKVTGSSSEVSIWVGGSEDILGYRGREFSVPVSIENNPGFFQVNLSLDYDEDLFELVGYDVTGAIAGSRAVFDLDKDPHKIVIWSENTKANVTGDGLLFNAIFKVKTDAAAGTSSISLGLHNNVPENFVNIDDDLITATFVSKDVEVQDQMVPTADDFETNLPLSVVYGNSYAVAVTKSNSDVGAFTVYYSGTYLDGTAYAKTTTAPINAGNYTVSVDVEAATLYGPATDLALGSLTITKAAAPIITWPTASSITWPQALSASSLSVTTNAYGSFDWSPGVDTTEVLDPDTHSISVTFTPSALTANNYQTISPLTQDVQVLVNKAALDISAWDWPTASTLTYGQAISASTLNPDANTYGTFAWASSVTTSTVLNFGDHQVAVTFTPSADTSKYYTITGDVTRDVTLHVNKAAAPPITWPTAADIKEGWALSKSALNAGSTEYGSFAWTTPTTVPALPGGAYSVTFTPSEATLLNYEAITTLTQNVNVKVWMAGDLDRDGNVTARDVLYHLRYIQAVTPAPPSTSLDYALADMDDDGFLVMSDTILLLRKSAGLL